MILTTIMILNNNINGKNAVLARRHQVRATQVNDSAFDRHGTGVGVEQRRCIMHRRAGVAVTQTRTADTKLGMHVMYPCLLLHGADQHIP